MICPVDITQCQMDSTIRFSVCTMVTNPQQYQEMLDTFYAAGFNELNTEYIYIDNTLNNSFDAFSAARHFFTHAKGQYIILCHQDLLLNFDDVHKLNRCIEELNLLDPQWALAGNAGGVELHKCVGHITDPNGEVNTGVLPHKVHSLDENFIVLRRDCNPGVSSDLSGFHLYGLDLCRHASLRGYNAYVIDFHLTHLSAGKSDESFSRARIDLINKYSKSLKGGYYQTTCTNLYLSGSCLMSLIMNLIVGSRVIRYFFKWRRSIRKRINSSSRNPLENL